jgi:hypothetical protein
MERTVHNNYANYLPNICQTVVALEACIWENIIWGLFLIIFVLMVLQLKSAEFPTRHITSQCLVHMIGTRMMHDRKLSSCVLSIANKALPRSLHLSGLAPKFKKIFKSDNNFLQMIGTREIYYKYICIVLVF